MKFTKVRLKGFNNNHSQKEMLVFPMCMWRNKINLNNKLSCALFSNVNGENISSRHLMSLLMSELKSGAVYYQVSIIKL